MPEQAATESGLIVVELSAEHELEADHVDAVVDVKASEFFTGNAAFTNAREVASLVGRMGELGVPASAFTLQAVQAETSEGLLSRSSSARYTVRIHLADMGRVGDVLAALSGLKQATLRELRWGYTREPEARQDWLEALARESVKKARRVAAGLGVTLAGLHRFSERTWESQTRVFGLRAGGYGGDDDMRPLASTVSSYSAPRASASMGFTVSHRKKVQVMATAEFRTHPAPES
ncbi:SIMPL domain-containing protein [Corallococcus sp. AB011P]|uniref:SIMPL domain-containing protein n=1 Tax=unclassified Corallococcus TaxID=2685029 RepID=UPI000EA258C0|nr:MULTISPECIES: SIMPL domain-containing protein [unclassified Corallococcus]RKG52048.1 SIMPL domain-containing protein [Corallococcus sp. AB011P]RKH90540.1 SIMPL domain-containing protein [Corallococcus sp. AB045]